MNKTITLGILVVSAMFLASCSKSPTDKLVGEWQMTVEAATVTVFHFKSDGTGAMMDEKMEWKVAEEDKDKETLKLEFYQDAQLQDSADVTFISDDEITMAGGGEKMVLKRKKE